MRRAQGALEYLFLLAAVLILITIAIGVVGRVTLQLAKSTSNYANAVRRAVIENL